MHDNSRNEHIQSDETIRIIRFRKEKKKKTKNHICHRSFVAIKRIIESAFKYFQNFYSI